METKICAVLTDGRKETLRLANRADLVEIRIDMIGPNWKELVEKVKKPWIATNRKKLEGGFWTESEEKRICELLEAVELGASFIDIELSSTGLERFVEKVKKRCELIISFHNMKVTPSLKELRRIVLFEIKKGAHICKIVTRANNFEDNLRMLELVKNFSRKYRITGFCMGNVGLISRILSPLVGGSLVYVSLSNKKSAEGQIELEQMRKIMNLLVI